MRHVWSQRRAFSVFFSTIISHASYMHAEHTRAFLDTINQTRVPPSCSSWSAFKRYNLSDEYSFLSSEMKGGWSANNTTYNGYCSIHHVIEITNTRVWNRCSGASCSAHKCRWWDVNGWRILTLFISLSKLKIRLFQTNWISNFIESQLWIRDPVNEMDPLYRFVIRNSSFLKRINRR